MSELFTLKPGNLMTISWSGEERAVTCDRIEDGGAVIRDLTDEEQDNLDRKAYEQSGTWRREAAP